MEIISQLAIFLLKMAFHTIEAKMLLVISLLSNLLPIISQMKLLIDLI